MATFSKIYEDASSGGKVVLALLAIILWFIVVYLVKILWNDVCVDLFNLPVISYGQSIKLNLLVWFLFGKIK